MKNGLLLLLFLTVGISLRAQVITIKSGDKSIRYDLIRPAHTFQKVTAYDSTGNPSSAIVNESVVKIDSAKHQIMFVRIRQVPFGHTYTDTSIINYNSPVRYHATSVPLTYEVNALFNENSVAASGLRKGVHSVNKNQLSPGYFDDNIIEETLGYMPIEKNKKYHLEGYRFESKDGINPFDIEYVFDDFIQKPEGGVTVCRVLHYVNGYSSGYIWVDKKTRQFLKEVLYFGNTMDLIQVI